MARVRGLNKKKGLETPIRQAQSDSARGVKRSAEKGENEKTEESNTEKRGRPAEKETLGLLEKVEEENEQKKEETKKELIETRAESSDSSYSETSFMDLPDDCLRHIFYFLDLPSSHKLRVNKRLEGLQSVSVKHKIKKISINFGMLQSQLVMGNRLFDLAPSSSFSQLEDGLRRLSMTVFVERISIQVNTSMDEQHGRVVDALFHFNSDYLRITGAAPVTFNLSHLTLPSFITLSQNVRKVYIRPCVFLTAQDLCTIRKNMEGGCIMKSFYCYIGSRKYEPFLEECFGVTVKGFLGPLRGVIYCSANDSMEMYADPRWFLLQHFEGDLKTVANTALMSISFEKLEVVDKSDASTSQFKIRWNHFYRDY